MSATLSVIVVNYNAGRFLRRCLDLLLNCPLKLDVIVVDNASNDGSLEHLLGLNNIQIIKNSSNLGFAAACNKGVRASSAPLLLFLNPDCLLKPGVLNRLIEVLNLNHQVGMVSGFLANPDGTEQAGGRRAVPTPWRSFVRAFGLTSFSERWPRLFFDFHMHRQPIPTEPIEVEAISGAFMMVKREALEGVGEWDERYFLHCEDLDLCMRFRQNGWKILFVPSVQITHVSGVCSRNRPIFVEWNKHKGMILFYRKFFHKQYPGILMWLVIVGVWLRFLLVATYYLFMQFSFRTKKHNAVTDEALLTNLSLQQMQKDRNQKRVSVIGATSLVGRCLLTLLATSGWQITAFSRQSVDISDDGVEWRKVQCDEHSFSQLPHQNENMGEPYWVFMAPIWTLPEYFSFLEKAGVKRLVAVSSTSRFTKHDSTDTAEQVLALKFADAEARVQKWAESRGVEWVILRPTLIYGLGADKNLTEIARFIRFVGVFPLLGKATGLRQPIHAEDVANACMAALESEKATNHAYNISGSEILTYREMVARIFAGLGRKPRFLSIPLWIFKAIFFLIHYIPRYRKWSPAMAERMNRDLIFAHEEAERDLFFKPRAFENLQLNYRDVD